MQHRAIVELHRLAHLRQTGSRPQVHGSADKRAGLQVPIPLSPDPNALAAARSPRRAFVLIPHASPLASSAALHPCLARLLLADSRVAPTLLPPRRRQPPRCSFNGLSRPLRLIAQKQSSTVVTVTMLLQIPPVLSLRSAPPPSRVVRPTRRHSGSQPRLDRNVKLHCKPRALGVSRS